MRAVRITWRRTMGMAKSLLSTVLAFSLFFAAAAVSFAFALEMAEGGETPLAVVWASAVSPVLPVLAALLAMDVWSDERRSGRIEALLTIAVRERELTIGKFLGVFTLVAGAMLAFLISSLFMLSFMAPGTLENQPISSFFPGIAALMLQGALWCALSVCASAAFRHAAAAALTAITLTVLIPRGLWFALMEWAPQGRMSFGEMPLDANAFDLSSGLISTATVLTYAILTVFALFVSSKLTASVRFVGRGSRSLRISTGVTLALATTLVIALIALFHRTDTTFELPFAPHADQGLSARTRSILADVRGEFTVTAFLSRKDSRFRPLGHFLRSLAREAEGVGGAHLTLRFVDPRWDVAAAERLVRDGANEDSLVFERGNRRAFIPLAGGFDERLCASAILRVAVPPKRGVVYWTSGHGECSFRAYEPWGMSDIARNISHYGYRNAPLDLSADSDVPDDCALVIMAGAKSDFSRAEAMRLDAYLRKGGRLFALLSSSDATGIASMLSGWGIHIDNSPIKGARTLSGTDVIVSDFGDHPVCDPLKGAQIILEKPFCFTPSAAADVTGVDRIEYTPLASVGDACVAAAAERGVGTGEDLSLRPTRIIAVGDAAFVMNGQLKVRGNANRDFFLNSLAYLAGTDAITEPGTEANRLVSGMDRAARVHFVIISALVFPGIIFFVALAVVAAKRRRS